MKISNEAKKKITILVIVVFILILIAGGLFYWWRTSNYVLEDGRVNSKYYVIKDGSDGQVIENEKEGFQITVPSNWVIQKHFGTASAYSPDTQFDEKGRLIFQSIKDGACGVIIEIIKYKPDPESANYSDYIKILIEAVKTGKHKEDIPKNEVILIKNREGLLVTYIKEEEIRKITLEIPINNTLYSFDSGMIFNEKCVDEFYKIIETISIK